MFTLDSVKCVIVSTRQLLNMPVCCLFVGGKAFLMGSESSKQRPAATEDATDELKKKQKKTGSENQNDELKDTEVLHGAEKKDKSL